MSEDHVEEVAAEEVEEVEEEAPMSVLDALKEVCVFHSLSFLLEILVVSNMIRLLCCIYLSIHTGLEEGPYPRWTPQGTPRVRQGT